MPTPDDRSSPSEAELLARRARTHARSLAGRVFLAPGRVFLVRGTPDALHLIDRLAALTSADTPTPADLGFAADNVTLVTHASLSSRGRSLQKWRTNVVREREQGRVRPERDSKLSAWLAEIEPLSAQVAALHRLLAAADEPMTGSPCWLPPDAEADLIRLTNEIAGSRVVPADVRWLVRLAAWIGSTATARRLLFSVRDALSFPADHESRAALLVVRQRVQQLAALLQQLDPTPLAQSKEYEEAERLYDRERRESPLFDALRRAVAELPARLTGPGGVVVPVRNREVDPKLLLERCDAALATLPAPPSWPELARLAALYLCDGGSTFLPWAFAADHLLGDVAYLLLAQSREPGYDLLLDALGQLEKCWPWAIPRIRALLVEGVSVEDVRWCQNCCTSALHQPSNGRAVRPVRAVVEWLAAHEAPLDGEEIEHLWEATTAAGGREGVESLLTYLDWLPAETVARLAGGVRGLVLLLSVPGSLRGPLRDHFRTWAEPPRGVPLPDDCPEGLPEDVRVLLRRLAYYQRAASQPARLPKSLRKPLGTAVRHEKERQFLLANAATLDEKQQARLAHLSEASEEASHAPARLLRQAREVCAITALQAARELFRREIEAWWHRRFGLDAGLDSFRWEDLGKLVNWVEGLKPEERNRVERILSAFAQHGTAYREHLWQNEAWLVRLREAGRDVEAWQRAEAREVVLEGGRTVTIGPATDPREVFLMGSWFSTCLDLAHGVNRSSVIANAAEANKAVVYAWSAEGRPLARKLVCVTPNLGLIGFHTYVVPDAGPGAAEAVDRYCAAWAAAVGFPLADVGRPASLGAGFWYDDGLVDWTDHCRRVWAEARAAGPALSDVTTVGEEGVEAAWVAAVRGDDPLALEAVLATPGPSEWRKSAAFWWAVKFPARAATRPVWWAELAEESWDFLPYLEAAGHCTGPASFLYWEKSADARDGVIREGRRLLSNVPPDADAVRDAIAEFSRIQGASDDSDDCFYCCGSPPPTVGLVSVADVMRLLESARRIMRDNVRCRPKGWVKGWARVLRAAWLRERDAGPLVRALRGGETWARDVLLGLCREVFIPELVRELRRTARRTTDQAVREEIGEALSQWGTTHEAQRRSGSKSLPDESDPHRIATDPRRPLAQRLEAAQAAWDGLGDAASHARAIADWTLAFTETERAALPDVLRRGVVKWMLRADARGHLIQAWQVLAWLRTFPPAEQVALWRTEAGGLQALQELSQSDGPGLCQALALTQTAEAARCALIAAAGADPWLLTRLLDAALLWLHPDVSERLAAEVLGYVDRRAALSEAGKEAESFRLRRLTEAAAAWPLG